MNAMGIDITGNGVRPTSRAPSAMDADGDPLIFGIDARPAWAQFNTATGVLSGTPTTGDVGTHRGILVWVSDGKTQTTLPAFELTVMAPPSGGNRAPTISGTPATSLIVGAQYSFTPTANDADGQPLTTLIRRRSVPDGSLDEGDHVTV